MKVLASFLIGLLLAPLAGVIGLFWVSLLVGGIPTFHTFNFNLAEAIDALLAVSLLGLFFASPVTAIALPCGRLILQMSEIDDRLWLPAIGFITGLFPLMILEPHPLLMLGGGIAGCFCGYILSIVMRVIDPIRRNSAATSQTVTAVS